LLDTAAIYHQGASETVLGNWLAERGPGCREEIVLATKVTGSLSREAIFRSCDESLKRLKTDLIDLYQLHNWDPETPLEETLNALESLRTAGKIRFGGCSNWTADQLKQADVLAKENESLVPMNSIQPPYNLVQREIEADVIPFCEQKQIGVVAYSPLAAGFLTGKYRPGGEIPAGARFDVIPQHQPIYFTQEGWRILEGLQTLAERENRSMIDLALAWVVRQSGVTSVLAGARDPRHVDQIIEACNEPMSGALLDELSALLSV
jgi:aryl-alcohol dehydrogenase-like predicted oxidoreductase